MPKAKTRNKNGSHKSPEIADLMDKVRDTCDILELRPHDVVSVRVHPYNHSAEIQLENAAYIKAAHGTPGTIIPEGNCLQYETDGGVVISTIGDGELEEDLAAYEEYERQKAAGSVKTYTLEEVEEHLEVMV
jgi:hypothetical protein